MIDKALDGEVGSCPKDFRVSTDNSVSFLGAALESLLTTDISASVIKMSSVVLGKSRVRLLSDAKAVIELDASTITANKQEIIFLIFNPPYM